MRVGIGPGLLSFSRKFLGVMVNRMVFFYVYVIAERFTSDFGESLLPVLFSPTEPKNTAQPIFSGGTDAAGLVL